MGMAENNIIVWDRGDELVRCGYTINESGSGVRCFGTAHSGVVDYDPDGVSVHDETVFLSRIVTAYSNYIINVSCLKAHGGYNGAGVTLCLKNHYGSFSLEKVFNFKQSSRVSASCSYRRRLRIISFTTLRCWLE